MDGCIQKELASACGIEPATLSEILNRMEKRNLISRQESVTAGGKHAMRVHLTQEGLDLYADVDAIVKDVEKLSFKGFSKAERQQFMSFFERIYLNLGVN
jgi:DNA-binding MarR family transcriptional regulator